MDTLAQPKGVTWADVPQSEIDRELAHLAQYIIDKYTGAVNTPKSATSHKAARRELSAILFALQSIGYDALFVANLQSLVRGL